MRAFAAALAALTFVGCGFSSSTTSTEESFTVERTPRVFVTTFNGDIEARTGSAGEVRFVSTRRGEGLTEEEAERDMENIEIISRQEGDDIFIDARRIDREDGGGAAIEVVFPAGASLELRTSNSAIRVEGDVGPLLARTSNGKVSATALTGNADVQTSNGAVELTALTPVRVNAITSDGAVTFKGPLGEGRNAFTTSNGPISLTLPGNSSFKLNAITSNGGVSVDFPITQEHGTSTENVRGTVGSDPRVEIEAVTSNARISIKGN